MNEFTVVYVHHDGCHGLHVDTGEFQPVGQKVDRGLLSRQKMNITLYLTALHIAQSGTDILPFSGDQPLICLLSLHESDMTPGSLPSFCINVCTQVCVVRGYFRGAAALVAVFHLQLSGPPC